MIQTLIVSFALIGVGCSSIISGILVILITQTVYANVPDQSDIAKMFVDATAKLKLCGDNTACTNTVQLELNAIDLYQKENSAKATGQLFGIVLIVLPPALGIMAFVR